MPFKSEKQRRFLWAEHPEIAKRWAHEYPESNKDLPMYAHKNDKKQDESKSDEKAAQINVSALIRKIADNWSVTSPSILGSETTQNSKKADSKQEKIDIPHSDKPTYAGEEREKGVSSEDIPLEKNLDGNCGGNAINSLLQKLSVVLSPSIQQTMENMNAENEGRVPRRLGRNSNLKHYPISTPQIPLPMGMQQSQAQAQPQQAQSAKPASPTPVGAGQSSATTDPIKFHSGLSASGIINGNAALSAPNTVNTKISAENTIPIEVNVPQVEFESEKLSPVYRSLLGAGLGGRLGIQSGALLGGLAGTVHGALTQPGEYVDAKGNKQKRTRLQKVLHDALSGVGIGGLSGGALGAAGGAALPFISSEKTSAAGNSILAQLTSIHGTSEHDIADLLDEEAYERMKKAGKGVPCSCGCGDTVSTCKCPASCSCRKPGGSCYKTEKEATLGLWDRIRAKRERGGKPAKPGDKDYPDAKSWKKVTAISEKQSGSTPAWQRSAGKNEEGGLNAKGRASYNRETGGHLKAPVTEKNPTGKAKKRRHSFCSRMCGMKRVNTGSKTKSDPDSRINKALRKWNCKCGSEQKTANWFKDSWPNTSLSLTKWGPELSYQTTPLHTIMGTLAGAGYGGLTGRNIVRNALRGGLIGTGAGLGGVFGSQVATGLNADLNGQDDFFHNNSYLLGSTVGTLGGALGGNKLYNVLESMYDKHRNKKKQQEKTSAAAAFGFKVAQDIVKDFDPALSRDAENAIMHGTGLVGSGALGTVAGIPISAGLEHLVRQNKLMPDSEKSPWSHFFTQALIRTPIIAGGMLGTRLYDNYILRPHMRREMERKKQEDEIRQQLAMKKQAEASLGRVLGTALASTGGGLLIGGYPGWKLQRASEAAGNNDFMNFIAGKAPIALAGALSGAAFNHMYDRYEKKHPPKHKTPANPSLQYLQYLVH